MLKAQLDSQSVGMMQFLADITPFFYGKSIVYVDVGAHTGQTFADIVASGFSVDEAHLVEPNPISFAALEARLAGLQRPRRLFRYNAALGETEGVVRMLAADTMTKVVGNMGGAISPPNNPKHFDVPLLTLDAMAQNFISKHISILKIDVEGYEEQVLRGARGFFASENVDILHIETGMNPTGTQQCCYRKIEDLVAAHGYRLFKIYEQKNGWVEDSPLLRCVNLAFVSHGFAKGNPFLLSTKMFEARSRIKTLKSAVGTAEGKIVTLQKELGATAASREQAESRVSELRSALESAAKAAEAKIVTLGKELSAAVEAREEVESRVSQLQGALESAAKAAEGKIVALEKSSQSLWRMVGRRRATFRSCRVPWSPRRRLQKGRA
jgi:FkbM family methyltransferase